MPPAVRKHGVEQFLHVFDRVRHRANDTLRWGDEIEYHLVRLDSRDGVKASAVVLLGPEVLAALADEDATLAARGAAPPGALCSWHPEYGSWMVEATPGAPYGGDTSDLRLVEHNMAVRCVF